MLKILGMIGIVLVLSSNACDKEHKSGERFQTVQKEHAILLQTGKNKASCVRCGMNLVAFYKTSHAAKSGDTQFQYCSIHCLAEHENSGVKLTDKKVVDLISLKFIDVRDAQYVVGSEIPGTMSRTSKYVFRHAKNAKIFQSKFGGEIMDYNGALNVAQKDFK